MQKGFFSIVEDRDDPVYLIVRARVKGDIEKVWPKAEVEESPNNDYLYRTRMRRSNVLQGISSEVIDITYDNFKANIEDKKRRDPFYMTVWAIMCDMQDALKTAIKGNS